MRISLSLGGISSLILGWGASLSHDPVVGEFLVLECVVVVSSNLKFWCKQEQVVVIGQAAVRVVRNGAWLNQKLKHQKLVT